MTSVSIIRQKILERAMRGDLVSQNEKDEHASILFSKIQEEKQKLIHQKVIKKQKSLPPIESSEPPYELPEGWIWTRLGEVGDWGSGSTPKRSNPKYYNGEIFWLKTGELNDGYVSYSEEKITELALSECSLRLNKPGDVLIAMYGATIGKLAILEVEATTNQACCACTTFSAVSNKFLFYYLKSLKSYFIKQGEGGAQPNISKEKIINTLFPLPPYDEQRRIVEKIEKLFALCDKWEREVEFQKESIENLRKKVFNDALQGLLVSQKDNDEPATILLEKIQKEKEELIKNKKMKKTKPLPPIEEKEISCELPLGWTWVRIGDIAQINPRNSIDDESEVGFVPMTLIEDGYSGKHTSETRQWKDIKKGFTHFQENDIAIAKITPCFENKKSTIMKDLPNGYGAGTTELHIVRPFHDYVLADYLMCLFKSNTFIEKGVQTYTGTAGQQRVSKGFVENYVIGLPPIKEQKRIVEKVMTVLDKINEIESNMILVK